MGECYCSNITIMQLFHELKQQFPALPDHIVSQCIAQNSHDKETCARSLRATQESRPSPGAFPPRAQNQLESSANLKDTKSHAPTNTEKNRGMTVSYHRTTSLNGVTAAKQYLNGHHPHPHPRAHRPASLDIGRSFGPRHCTRSPNERLQRSSKSNDDPESPSDPEPPASAPPTFFPTRSFFEDYMNCSNRIGNQTRTKINVGTTTTTSIPTTTTNSSSNNPSTTIAVENKPRNRPNQPTTTGFEVNVNVACSPAGNHNFRILPQIGSSKRSDLVVDPRPHYSEPRLAQTGKQPPANTLNRQQLSPDQTRSYTSVSLTLRPPSSEPQAPIDIRSQGSSLTYSTSSLDPRGFQSRLQISIGPGSVGSVASARIRPPMGPSRPNTLIPHHQAGQQRRPGLPAGPPSQLPRPTTTMSAPTTPSAPVINLIQPISLPTTPSTASTILSPPPGSPTADRLNPDLESLPSNEVAEPITCRIREQLMRKEKLAKELRAEKGRLEAMKRELQALTRPVDSSVPHEEAKRKLVSEIYQLQLECDRLADEVDKRSDPRVPLGETNEEFYQSIYTGQPFALNGNYGIGTAGTRAPNDPPPLPNRPLVWQNPATRINHHLHPQQPPNVTANRQNSQNDDWGEVDGPSWVCRMCTFDNHPLMDKCEQCDMPRLLTRDTGETQDIHIRVTHHHNFNSPRRTVHSWVV